MGMNPSGKFDGGAGSSKAVGSQEVQSSRALINQIRGTAVANTLNSGIPKHVMHVSASMARASSGTTSAIRVLFHRDPSDTSFTKALVFVRGYQGNSSPVQVASGTASPITVVLNNTGETLSFHVQASGNAGDAPFSGCPTTGATLPLSTGGGFGSQTQIVPPPSFVGVNVADAPATTMSNHGTGLNTDAVTYSQLFTASGILSFPPQWKITVNVQTGPIAFQNFVVARTLPGSLTVIDYTPITFGGTSAPTLATGLNTSDAITLQIDSKHDYWFMAYSVHQSGKLMYSLPTQFGANTEGGVISGGTGKTSPFFNDYTAGAVGAPNTIVPPNTAFGLWLSPWQGA